MHVLADRKQPLAQRALFAPQGRELLVLLRALRLTGRELHARLRNRTVHGIEHGGQRGDNLRRGGDLALADHREAGVLLGGFTLGDELRRELLGASPLRPDSFTHGLELDA